MTAVSFGRRLTELAAERPGETKLTIVSRDGAQTGVSWQTLETRANQIARALESRGVGEADIVALALPTCLDHILVTLAIWKLGATLLPLRHDQPQWEMDRLLELADPAAMVSDTHTARCPLLTRDDLAATTSLPDHALPDRTSEIINLGASSGSTGQPKLITTPFPGVIMADPNHGHLLGSTDPVILVTSPLYHVNGFAFATPPLLEGARVVLMETFDAALAVDLIEAHSITFGCMVPTMLQRIARLPDLRADRFASITRLIYGGAKIPEWVVDTWLQLIDPEAFVFTYGSSERLGLCTMTGADWPHHRGSTGRPVDVELSIRDEEGNPVPTGTVGQVHMKPLDPDRRLFEYIGMATPKPSTDGFLTIGDLGWVDDDGFLHVADRRKDLIVTGGANVFPAEVEAALSEHAGIVDQVVVPVPDEEWGHRVHAIVQPTDPHSPPTVEELRAWCKARLASYKVPKTYELVEQIPRTEAGKLNRTALGETR